MEDLNPSNRLITPFSKGYIDGQNFRWPFRTQMPYGIVQQGFGLVTVPFAQSAGSEAATIAERLPAGPLTLAALVLATPVLAQDQTRQQTRDPSTHVDGATAQGTHRGGVRDAAPESLECGARAFGAPLGMAIDEHCGVHGAGRGPRDGLDGEGRLLEQPVEHAPGEGAMRAAALKGEVDALGVGHGRRLRGVSVAMAASVAAFET